MIKYKLNCKNCKNTFDSWFASSKEFEKLQKMKLVTCSNCNSLKIEKSIMAPRISTNIKLSRDNKNTKYNEVKSKIKEFQKYINKNFDYVGNNFSFEARSIHYGKRKTKKGIYGSASKKEISELKEEGIHTSVIPWMEDKEN